MKDKLKKFIKDQRMIVRMAHLNKEERGLPIKDIKTNKYTSEAPDLNRIILKTIQRPKNKPSMPKMPWEI